MPKTVLITGASRGIGAKIAELFAEKGYNIALNYNKSEHDAISLCEKINSRLKGIAHTFKADVSDYEDVRNTVNAIYKNFGGNSENVVGYDRH